MHRFSSSMTHMIYVTQYVRMFGGEDTRQDNKIAWELLDSLTAAGAYGSWMRTDFARARRS